MVIKEVISRTTLLAVVTNTIIVVVTNNTMFLKEIKWYSLK